MRRERYSASVRGVLRDAFGGVTRTYVHLHPSADRLFVDVGNKSATTGTLENTYVHLTRADAALLGKALLDWSQSDPAEWGET
jgi:hypothetical protein